MNKHKKLLWLFLPFILVMLAFQVMPLLWIIVNSFKQAGSWSIDNYSQILTSAYYRQAMRNAFELAMYSSVSCLIIATIFCQAISRSAKGSNILVSIVNMLSNFSGVPLAFAFIIILGFNGTITAILVKAGFIEEFNLYSKLGLTLVYIYFQIPLSILLLYPAFDALRPEWHEAAALLGAPPRKYWQYIGLPILIRPLTTTFVILFADAIGSYATAYALTSGNYNLLTLRISSLVSGDLFPEPELAATLSVVLICSILIVASVAQLFIRRKKYA